MKRDSSHILLGYFNIPLSAFRRSLIWSRLTHQVIRSLSVYLDHISRTSPPPALSIDLTLSYFPQIPTTPSYLGNRLLHLDNTWQISPLNWTTGYLIDTCLDQRTRSAKHICTWQCLSLKSFLATMISTLLCWIYITAKLVSWYYHIDATHTDDVTRCDFWHHLIQSILPNTEVTPPILREYDMSFRLFNADHSSSRYNYWHVLTSAHMILPIRHTHVELPRQLSTSLLHCAVKPNIDRAQMCWNRTIINDKGKLLNLAWYVIPHMKHHCYSSQAGSEQGIQWCSSTWQGCAWACGLVFVCGASRDQLLSLL